MNTKPPFIRSPYNYDLEKASDEAAYKETMPSLTIQSQTLDTDINEIVRRVGIGAPMPTNTRIPTYGDYTDIKDFRSAIEAVQAAEQHFMQLPAAVRATFENDPQQFLDFCSTPGHEGELKAWGLTKPSPPEAPGATIAPPPATTGTPPNQGSPGGANAPPGK